MSRERVIVYTDTLAIENITPSLGDREVLRAASNSQIARAIVERNRVTALIIEKTKIDEPFLRLLSSIKKSFPLLEICLIADRGAGMTSSGRAPSLTLTEGRILSTARPFQQSKTKRAPAGRCLLMFLKV